MIYRDKLYKGQNHWPIVSLVRRFHCTCQIVNIDTLSQCIYTIISEKLHISKIIISIRKKGRSKLTHGRSWHTARQTPGGQSSHTDLWRREQSWLSCPLAPGYEPETHHMGSSCFVCDNNEVARQWQANKSTASTPHRHSTIKCHVHIIYSTKFGASKSNFTSYIKIVQTINTIQMAK